MTTESRILTASLLEYACETGRVLETCKYNITQFINYLLSDVIFMVTDIYIYKEAD